MTRVEPYIFKGFVKLSEDLKGNILGYVGGSPPDKEAQEKIKKRMKSFQDGKHNIFATYLSEWVQPPAIQLTRKDGKIEMLIVAPYESSLGIGYFLTKAVEKGIYFEENKDPITGELLRPMPTGIVERGKFVAVHNIFSDGEFGSPDVDKVPRNKRTLKGVQKKLKEFKELGLELTDEEWERRDEIFSEIKKNA